MLTLGLTHTCDQRRSHLLIRVMYGCLTIVLCGTVIRIGQGFRSVRLTRSRTHHSLFRRGRLRIRGVILSGYLSAVGRRAVCCPDQVGRMTSGLGNRIATTRQARLLRGVSRLIKCCGSVFALLDSYTSHRLRRIAFHHARIKMTRLTRNTRGCLHGIVHGHGFALR